MLLFPLSCATATGPLFKEVQSENHKGKAVVYFYRNSHAGSASALDLGINGHFTLPLLNKGYLLLVLEPGTYEFKVFFDSKKLQAENTFALQGDETYFIRYWAEVVRWESGPLALPLPGGNVHRPVVNEGITSVPREEALEVLKNCRLIEMPGKP